MVNDVMELARDPEGTGQEEPSRFSIGRVFDSVHGVVRPIAEEKKIGLEFSLPEFDSSQRLLKSVSHRSTLERIRRRS